MNFVADEEVERALDYLRDSAAVAANARASRVYMDEYRKVVKAELMGEHEGLAANLREQYAYADPRYKKHLQAQREAVLEDARHQFLREAALARIEAWRTQSATERAMKL